MSGLRIVVTADPYLPVPPRLYGGIERVIDIVVRGLAARGHTITLLAHPESTTPARLIPYGVPPHTGRRSRTTELWQVASSLWQLRDDIDAVLSWGRLAALLPILPCRRLAKIQRYCRNAVPWRGVKRAVRLAGPSIRFAGASASVFDGLPAHGASGGQWQTVFDGIEVSRYTFVDAVSNDAPLVFLGRLERIKGVHSAIAIARQAGRRLIIAGNVTDDQSGRTYFESEVAPHLDGDRIVYVGPVDDAAKNTLLGRSAALLFPIEWKEAFGIVMAEALACGTPVIAFPYGSVPEVVKDGINGFLCRDVNEAVEAVARLDRVDRAVARADCEARFSDRVLVTAFDDLIRIAVSECRADPAAERATAHPPVRG